MNKCMNNEIQEMLPDLLHGALSQDARGRAEAHLATWLSKRLGTQLRVPHLGEQGFSLVGGRLLPGQPDERAPVAHFMYQDSKGQRLTLYVRVNAEPSRDSAFRFVQEKNVGVFYWVDQKLGYALSGEIEKADLLRVAG